MKYKKQMLFVSALFAVAVVAFASGFVVQSHLGKLQTLPVLCAKGSAIATIVMQQSENGYSAKLQSLESYPIYISNP